jgi:hypothetical protein
MHPEEHAGEIDVDGALPIARRQGIDRPERDNAGVVDQDLHRSPRLLGLRDDRLPAVGVGDVEVATHHRLPEFVGVRPPCAENERRTLESIEGPSRLLREQGSNLRQEH